MHLHLAGLLILPLGGCVGGNLRGAWTGACDFSDGSYGGPVYVDAEISRDLGRSLAGSALVTLPDDGVYDVDLDGERAGRRAILRFVVPSGTGELELIFEGERDADELEGSCELWVPGAVAPIVGTGELAR